MPGVFCPVFLTNLDFIDKFSQKSLISNITDVRTARATLMYANGRTVLTKLIGIFLDYAKGSKNKCQRLPFVKVKFFRDRPRWPKGFRLG